MKPAVNMRQIYSVDGNIASGKSMILDHISANRFQNTHCIQEPVAEWINMKSGKDLLGSFYTEKQRWSFCFENLVQLSRLKAHYHALKLINNRSLGQQKDKKTKIFLERSIYSSFHVFTENTFEDNGINSTEYDILKGYFGFFTRDLDDIFNDQANSNEDSNNIQLPFRLIYVRSDPNVCFERLKCRNRDSENFIDLNYLKNIHLKYESWVKKINKDFLIVIDGNQSKETVLRQIDNIIAK